MTHFLWYNYSIRKIKIIIFRRSCFMSDWWNKEKDIPYSNPNFIKIVDFYQHKCPVIRPNGERVANRGVDFKSKGWNSDLIKTLLCKMKNNNGKSITYHCCAENEKVEDVMSRLEVSNSSNFEAVVFIENKDLYKTQTIFYIIRNALAHSSFSVIGRGANRMYFFESQKGRKIKGQIRIKESTLLYWIDLFNEPEKCTKKKNLKRIVARNNKRKKAA